MSAGSSQARVFVIIVNYKAARLTLECVRCLEAERERLPNLQVAVVENASGEAAVLTEALDSERFEGWLRLVLAERNGGFAYGNNRGLEVAMAESELPDFIYMINPDTHFEVGAVHALVDFLERFPNVGIAGSRLFEEGQEHPFAFRFPSLQNEVDGALEFGLVTRLFKDYVVSMEMGEEPSPVDWVSGASFMVRREVFESVGSMDERYFLYFEETDFCRAAKAAGWGVWFVPSSEVTHLVGQSTDVTVRHEESKRLPKYWFESRRRYFLKNHGLAYALATDLAHGAAFALGQVKRALQGRLGDVPPHYLGDLMRNSVWWHANRAMDPPALVESKAETPTSPFAARRIRLGPGSHSDRSSPPNQS